MPTDRNELVGLLLQALAIGELDEQAVLDALRVQEIHSTGHYSRQKLLTLLQDNPHPTSQALRSRLLSQSVQDAAELHELRKSGAFIRPDIWAHRVDTPLQLPVGWMDQEASLEKASRYAKLLHDRAIIRVSKNVPPELTSQISKALTQAREEVLADPLSQFLLIPPTQTIPDNLKRLYDQEMARHENRVIQAIAARQVPLPNGLHPGYVMDRIQRTYPGAAPEARRPLLDALLQWPGKIAASFIGSICTDQWEQERALLTLTQRFGLKGNGSWSDMESWLRGQAVEHQEWLGRVREMQLRHHNELLLDWYTNQPNSIELINRQLEAGVARHVRNTNLDEFKQRWTIAQTIEWDDTKIAAAPDAAFVRPSVPPPIPGLTQQKREQIARLVRDSDTEAQPEPTPVSSGPPPVPPPPGPPEPVAPGFWAEHVQPFISSNWYVVAGVLMAIAGASLLAYFTWDKHWLIRYSIMPALLAGFTCGVAAIAGWVESRESALRATSAILRGAAIQLLPLNFIVVALLGRDPDVTGKAFILPLVLLIYLGFYSWQVLRWIGQANLKLRFPMTGTLMMANAALALAALSPVWSSGSNTSWIIWGVYHAAFVILAVSAVHVATRVLTPELVAERRIPWFFGLSVGLALFQAFLWGHVLLRLTPVPADYAVLMVLGGGLVLFTERRSIMLNPAHQGHGESFIGFGLILLGILFGVPDPEVRVAVFAAAGIVWLIYADATPGLLHYWIGLTAIMLSGASVGLLPWFPQNRNLNLIPLLGVAIAGIMGAIRVAARKYGRERLSETAREFQPVVLFLAAVTTVLSQWHVRSEPLHAGIALLVIAAIFGWRAHRVQRLHWVHTTMALLAVALPYLGFVDMRGHSLYGNTLVFGLALLSLGWIIYIALRKSPILYQARSTVLWSYGILAVAAMLLRIVMEQGRPGDFLWWRFAMDYAGPILMSVALVLTSYYSRSLIPSMMAVFILIILFPELRAKFPDVYERLQWGTGLGGAISALVCVLGAFPVRRARFLTDLGEGDLFLGRVPFPLRRHDSSLFTIPLILASLFLAARVDTAVFLQHFRAGTLGVSTAVALGLSAAVWLVLPVFLRAWPISRVLLALGWIEIFLCAYYLDRQWGKPSELQTPVMATLLIMHVLVVIYQAFVKKYQWVQEQLVQPTISALAILVSITSIYVTIIVTAFNNYVPVDVLWMVLVVQLAWFAIATRREFFGGLLFLLVTGISISRSVGGKGLLLDGAEFDTVLYPAALLIAGIQLTLLLLEFRPRWFESLRPIARPFQAGALALSVIMAIWMGRELVLAPDTVGNLPLAWLFVGSVILAARANRLAVMGLTGLLLAYALIQWRELLVAPDDAQRLWILASPWRTALLSLVCVGLVMIWRRAAHWMPHIAQGAYPLIPDARGPGKYWLLGAGWWLAVQATLFHTVMPEWRNRETQLAAPYIATLTYIISCTILPRITLLHIAAALATLGNIQLVNHGVGQQLRTLGVSGIHVVCTGLLLTLIQTSLVRLGLRRQGRDAVSRIRAIAVAAANHASLLAAALILLFLAVNYFTASDLTQIPTGRFIVSGILALIAGEYFRRAARNPSEEEKSFSEWFESAYHIGLTIAIWCFALLIPVFRTPATALVALGIPALYFYLRTEFGYMLGSDAKVATRYRNSSSVLCFALLALYTTYSLFQMILFPSAPVNTNHYHYNAPTLIAIGLLMVRLHGLGGTTWLALYGVLGFITGIYFTITWYPGLSPFDAPVPAAWIGIVISHIAVVAAYQHSPLRHAVQMTGRISNDSWHVLRQSWGRFLIVAVHVLALNAIRVRQQDSYALAPLLVGCASLLIHIGALRNVTSYLAVAAAELLAALHADFVLPSYVPRDQVVWILLAVWLLGLLALEWRRSARLLDVAGPVTSGLFLLVFAHVLYHHPSSNVGLTAISIAALLSLATPRLTHLPATGEQASAAVIPLVTVLWVVYFSQIRNPWPHLDPLGLWPVMTTAVTALALSAGADAIASGRSMLANAALAGSRKARLYHHTLGICYEHGQKVHVGVTAAVTGLSLVALVLHYGTPFPTAELTILSIAWAGCALAWFVIGRRFRTMLPYIAAQVCVLGLFALIRRQLMLTTTFWNYEYDVWVSLVISCFLAGGKARIRERMPEASTSAVGALFVIPAAAMAWVLIHGLGTDVALVVVGIHSLLYAFLGREDRKSPYNMIAIAGFVAFTSILFWSKLEFRVLHAYVIPAGIGILVLLHLMGENIVPATRERIRMVTLFTMLGATGYHALIDNRYPVWFHFTMLALCLGSMVLGSLFRVRAYLLLGFCGLVVDIASILYKTIAQLDAAYKMTSIGSLLLLFGVVVVTGSVYYKINHDAIQERLRRARDRFSDWQ